MTAKEAREAAKGAGKDKDVVLERLIGIIERRASRGFVDCGYKSRVHIKVVLALVELGYTVDYDEIEGAPLFCNNIKISWVEA